MPAKNNDYGYMLPLTLSLLAVLVSVVVVGAAVFGSAFQHQRTITVTATGTALANPAMATVYVTLNATGATAALANANLSILVGEFNSTLMPFLNGNVSRIMTQSYQVYQPSNCTYVNISYPYYCVYTKLDYYVAVESMAVTIPNINNLSVAVTQLSAIPHLQLQSIQAELSDSQKTVLNQEALSKALANATAQATSLAGSGTRIIVENISVQYSRIYPYYYSLGADASSAKSMNGTMFFGGTIEAQKSVYVVFSMH